MKMAVILCGSGYRDGSEIRESVAVLWALSTFNIEFQCFAPDAPQHDAVNCLTGKTMPENRNQLIESARIARGEVRDIKTLQAENFDGLLLPGGFGAAKNLCDFAFKGAEAKVIPELGRIINEFHTKKRPIGAVCIAPVIVGLALRGKKLELSVGKASDASRAIEKMGHRHVETSVTECCVDKANRIVTTPAYMDDGAKLAELFEGVRKMVGAVVELG